MKRLIGATLTAFGCVVFGCNAGGVMNYVFSALYGAAARNSMPLFGSTLGIVGVGSVGSRVETMARQLGFKVLLCDPPRAAKEGPAHFCPLDYLLENSDIVTLHVPLHDGTRAMANAAFFSKMREGAMFVNASRGEVVVDDDLIEAIGMPRCKVCTYCFDGHDCSDCPCRCGK